MYRYIASSVPKKHLNKRHDYEKQSLLCFKANTIATVQGYTSMFTDDRTRSYQMRKKTMQPGPRKRSKFDKRRRKEVSATDYMPYDYITGYPPRYQTLREMAEEIRSCRLKNINTPGMTLVEYPPIGRDRVTWFLQQHNELSSIHPRSIEIARVKDVSLERLQQWFNDLHDAIEKYGILPENMYNVDETGFAIGEREASKIIIDAPIQQQFQAKPGRQEWVSIVECICGDGPVLPPLVIFKAENLSMQWIPANIDENWKFSYNSGGWTSNEHGMQWLTRCFEPTTHDKAAGRFITDGDHRHTNGQWVRHCINNKSFQWFFHLIHLIEHNPLMSEYLVH